MASAKDDDSEPVQTRRRRRAPADARQEILDAAGALITELPLHEVTVAAIMARTTLSRKAFYVYFRDRTELILALVRPIRAEADAALQTWRAADDPVRAGRTALLAAARTYRQHGAVLRAVFRSAADDREVEAVRRELTEPVVSVALDTIARSGTVLAHPRATAVALVTMNVHSLLGLEPGTPDSELTVLVETLSTVWERTLLPPGAID